MPVSTLAATLMVSLLEGSLPGLSGGRGALAFGLAVLWLAAGLWTPGAAAALDHPEARQLRLWRAAETFLPRGATLVTPTRRGDARLDYPEVELHAARPDVRRIAWDAAWRPGAPGGVSPKLETPLWVFLPLSCEAPSLLAPRGGGRGEGHGSPAPRDDCQRIRQTWRLRPEIVAAMTLRAPRGAPGGGAEVSGDQDYWVFPGLEGDPPRAGLYRALRPGSAPPLAVGR